jgi:ribulose-phosphate 3-epimerase
MIQPVDALAGAFIDAGADLVSFHPDASAHVHRSVQAIKAKGCKAGLVLTPASSLDHIKYVMGKLDMLLLMSVNPGFGGQTFIPYVLDKLREARALIDASGFPIRLEVDGGVGLANIREVAKAGADTFVAGSAIFNAPNYADVIAQMREQLALVS